MIEYIDTTIRATAGEDLVIVARGVDAFGDVLPGCSFNVFDGDNHLFMVEGILNADNIWEFYIPADATKNLKGRYAYCVCDENHNTLCFKCPIYFI